MDHSPTSNPEFNPGTSNAPYDQKSLQKKSKEELVDIILNLHGEIDILKQTSRLVLDQKEKERDLASSCCSAESLRSTRVRRVFDFSKCKTRHILLRIAYLGWDFQGFAAQENSTSTIEYHLFQALTKTCLIESRQTCNYHRCGRTDKGVSSFGQVISLDVRSKYQCNELEHLTEGELSYCRMLNSALPKSIRAVAWRPAPPGFSARFDCCKRTYKYYFPVGNLNVEAMREGSEFLVGSHDFRNLCKMDVGNGVVNYVREIVSVSIGFCSSEPNHNSKYDMMVLKIVGSAFLWHQIRCIVAVLILIGQGNEQPDVFRDLLDVTKNPQKPQYCMANEIPLNLFHCQYPFDDNEWLYEDGRSDIENTFLQEWTFLSIKASMIKDMLTSMSETKQRRIGNDAKHDISSFLVNGVRRKNYQPLMKRQLCDSLESKVAHFASKRKCESKEDIETITQ